MRRILRHSKTLPAVIVTAEREWERRAELGDAHDYLDVEIERRDRRAKEEAAAREGKGRESGMGHCERTARERA
jgi:hypothetical protein